jgi:hypothetical protein
MIRRRGLAIFVPRGMNSLPENAPPKLSYAWYDAQLRRLFSLSLQGFR